MINTIAGYDIWHLLTALTGVSGIMAGGVIAQKKKERVHKVSATDFEDRTLHNERHALSDYSYSDSHVVSR